MNEGLEVLGTDEYPRSGLWSGVFEGSALEHMDLPSTLRRIEYSAFDGCEMLRRISLPDGLERIGRRCFQESGIEEIVFPPGLREVGPCAFCRCQSLRRAVLNEGLQTLGAKEVVDG